MPMPKLSALSGKQLERLADRIAEELHRREVLAVNAEQELQARSVAYRRAVEELTRCGRSACHCHSGGALHGPYWYVWVTFENGQRRKVYAGRAETADEAISISRRRIPDVLPKGSQLAKPLPAWRRS